MPDNATVNFLLPGTIDSFSVSINDINITVMPDTFGATQNATGPTANFTGRFTWMKVGGKITDLKKDGVPFNPTRLEVTIATKYKIPLTILRAMAKAQRLLINTMRQQHSDRMKGSMVLILLLT